MTAVMQPYLFPYIGYYQLVAAADHFVFYDDVQYINDGWINRNRLPHAWFTVPVAAAGFETPIKDRTVATGPYTHFRRKWRKGFAQRYGRAPYFSTVTNLLDRVLIETPSSISRMARRSVELTSDHLGLDCTFSLASEQAYRRDLSAQARLLSLLEARGATRYVNPIGGKHLYTDAAFAERAITLSFLTSDLDYTEEQYGLQYSIIHLLAHHPPARCREWLQQYTLTTLPRP